MIRRLLLFLASALTVLAVCVQYIPEQPQEPTPPEEPPVVPPSTNPPIVASAVMFPLEVLGPPGTIEMFSVAVTNGNLTDAIYLRVHSLTYEEKMSVRLNDGDWYTCNDTNVVYPKLEQGMWGMGKMLAYGGQRGPMATIKLTIPESVWPLNWIPTNGTNTLSFRFNEVDAMTIGFRVLEANLQHLGTNLIATSQFEYDDPSTWTAPPGADAVAGETAWRTLEITEVGSTAVISAPTTTLRSHCTDCHTQNGAEFKMWNFSNRSIIERSVFHGVPRVTATNIAAFIRGLTNAFEPLGRPWSPPYQPGPGLDSGTPSSWAVGAGLDAVFDDDLDTLTDIWGGPVLPGVLNMTNGINARHVRLAMQFPDIMAWFPQIHPIDAYAGRPGEPMDMITNSYVTIYATIRSNLLAMTNTQQRAVYFEQQMHTWDNAGIQRNIPIPPSKIEGTNNPAYAVWYFKEKGQKHWRAMKELEMMIEFNLQDQGRAIYNGDFVFRTTTNSIGHVFLPQIRTWFNGTLFNIAPHKTGTYHYDSRSIESATWYQLQLVLNDSSRQNPSISPIDCGYLHALLLSGWNNTTNYTWFACETLNVLKVMETYINGFPLSNQGSFRPWKEQLDWVQNPVNYGRNYATIDDAVEIAVCNAVVPEYLKCAEWFTRSDYEAAGLITDEKGAFWYSKFNFYGERMQLIGANPALVIRWNSLKDYLFTP